MISFAVSTASTTKRKRRPPQGFFDDDDDDEPDDAGMLDSQDEAQWKLMDEGTALASEGRYAEALVKFEAITDTDAVVYEARAQVLMALDRDFEAVTASEAATRLAPDWSVAFWTLARARRQLGEPDTAVQAFDRALGLDPENTDLQREVHECRALQRRLDGARHDILSSDSYNDEVRRCKAQLRPVTTST